MLSNTELEALGWSHLYTPFIRNPGHFCVWCLRTIQCISDASHRGVHVGFYELSCRIKIGDGFSRLNGDGWVVFFRWQKITESLEQDQRARTCRLILLYTLRKNKYTVGHVLKNTGPVQNSNDKCRARSDCKYMLADLALHSSKFKSLVANNRLGLKTVETVEQ